MRTMILLSAGLWVGATACSEYELGSDGETTPADGSDPAGPDTPDGPDRDESDTDIDIDNFPLPPDFDEPPPEVITECTGDAPQVAPTQLAVLSWSQTTQSGIITVNQTGWYHVYNTYLSESGAGQWNESSFFRIKNAARPAGKPYFANCDGSDWIVVDQDNFGTPPGSRIYIGSYWLEAGNNELEMNHYCPIFRAGSCPQHHYSGTLTCDSDSVNSVHFEGDGLCLVPG